MYPVRMPHLNTNCKAYFKAKRNPCLVEVLREQQHQVDVVSDVVSDVDDKQGHSRRPRTMRDGEHYRRKRLLLQERVSRSR